MLRLQKDYLESNIWPFCALSLALHLLAVTLTPKGALIDQEKQRVKNRPINIIDAQSFKQIKTKMLSRQIVRSDLGGRAEKSSDTRFLSQRTQSFERQSIASKVAPHKEAGKGQGGEKHKQRIKGLSKRLQLSDLGSVGAPIRIVEQKQEKKQGLENGNMNLTGLASNNDFIEDIPLGDFTQLNTTEFKYFGFYERIRKKLEQYWGFSLQQKARGLLKRKGHVVSNENYITSLAITINGQGKITRVRLMGSSGIRELDDAAIESFNKAGPFPNPPRGMLKKGYAKIRWNFVVQS